MPPIPVLALEGVPGSGKTTLFAALVHALGPEVLFHCEPNPTLAAADERAVAPASDASADLTAWYLAHEAARLTSAPDDPARLRLLDRNHLGVLAFCHAFDGEGAMSFADARARYEATIAPHLPTDTRTAVLLASPDTSLKRRGDHPELPRWEIWFDRGLLKRLHAFYTEIAPDLCPVPPLVIDTEHLTPAQVWAALTDAWPDLDLPTVPPFPAQQRPEVEPDFAALYRTVGGLGVLGHPVTTALPYRDGTVQLFQLGALHRSLGGGIAIWQPTIGWQQGASA